MQCGKFIDLLEWRRKSCKCIFKKVIGGNTYAYDGNVSFGKAQWDIWGKDIGKSSRLATNQHGFNEIAKKYNAVGRRPLEK